MNDFLNKMERKYGRRAIPHLTAVMIGLMAAGYIMQAINSSALGVFALNPHLIFRGQVWRIITWVLIPPTGFDVFTLIMLFFYLSIGISLERAWGAFRYNVYIFGGILLSVIAAIVTYAIFCIFYPGAFVGAAVGTFFSTYYICMSILLAYAATFPDAVVLLMFVIPLKMKYLGFLYGAFMIYDAIGYIRLIPSGGPLYLIPVIAMAASLVNFAIFFVSSRNRVHMTAEQKRRQKEFRRQILEADTRNQQSAREGGRGEKVTDIGARHRCEICGRTDRSDPELEFRYCSKCAGAHEYCMDHLYTHTHIVPGANPFDAGKE